METNYTIYKETIATNEDGSKSIVKVEIGSTTLEQLQNDLNVAISQRDRMQELVDLINRKIALANESTNNTISL